MTLKSALGKGKATLLNTNMTLFVETKIIVV